MNQIVPIASSPLAQFERVRHELEVAVRVDDVKDIRDKAEALRLYLRQAGESLEIQNAVAEIKLRAERRAGELLAEMEKNRGAQGSGSNQYEVSLHDVSAPKLADLGISHIQSHRWQQIAALPDEIFESYIVASQESRAELTSAALLRLAKRWQRSQQVSAIKSRPSATSASTNNGLYRLMRGDPRQFYDKFQARSVDCILTQPPPLNKAGSRDLYETLAREAARLLYPGSPLILLSQPADIAETLAIVAPHLRYHWTLVCLPPFGSVARRVPSRGLLTTWQPALWFTNGEAARQPWFMDVLRAVEKSDDAFSGWIHSEPSLMRLIEGLCNPRELVLDPFMGDGAVGAAALRLHLRFAGIDPDAQIIAAAAERLAALS